MKRGAERQLIREDADDDIQVGSMIDSEYKNNFDQVVRRWKGIQGRGCRRQTRQR